MKKNLILLFLIFPFFSYGTNITILKKPNFFPLKKTIIKNNIILQPLVLNELMLKESGIQYSSITKFSDYYLDNINKYMKDKSFSGIIIISTKIKSIKEKKSLIECEKKPKICSYSLINFNFSDSFQKDDTNKIYNYLTKNNPPEILISNFYFNKSLEILIQIDINYQKK